MNRNSLFGLVLLASACGAKSTPAPATPAAATTTATMAPAPAPVDPFLEFRKTYADPGGMWLPLQMALPQHAENFKKMGVALSAEQLTNPLADPLAAVVSLGGCTASFVSPEGLIVTNHHCVQGALQYNSDKDHNYVEDGFLAKTRADEKSIGANGRVMIAQAFTDVTKEMRDGLEKVADPIKRKDESETREKKLVAACEKDKPGIKCAVRSFFRGGMYELIESLEIRDVRLVYVPKRSVGDYGGEVDNWQWPRHTGDFSFYRAYVGKDGKPADFAAENVPYASKHFLKVSDKGVKDSDFIMVTGYPGSTNRTNTAAEIHHDLDWYYPYLIKYLHQRYDLLEELIKTGGNTAIKAGVAKQSVQNGLAKYQGVLDGMSKGDQMALKDALDTQVRQWAAQKGHEAIAKQIAEMDKLLVEQQKTARVDMDRNIAFGGSSLLRTAISFVRNAEERPKKDADRKPGFQDRDLTNKTAAQKAFARNYDRALDRGVFRLTLIRALDLPEKDRPWLATIVGTKGAKKIDAAAIDKALDTMYANTKMEDEATRVELLTKGSMAEMKASKDPFIKVAVALWPTIKAQEKKDDTYAGNFMLVAPAYVDAMRQVLGGFLSPDANSTLRVTYGTVRAMKPGATAEADLPFTFAKQLLTTETGKDPFNSPKAVLDAVRAKNYGPYADARYGGELPVDFLSDVDITGGNSGSPTLNDKGELVGLAFDGTIGGVSSDVVFNGDITRTIHVDARYMLWMMDAIDGADHLVKEMGVTPRIN